METAESSSENKRYNAELGFLDGLYSFHPEFFNDLSEQERLAIDTYYLTGKETIPNNIFEYRARLIAGEPKVEHKAQQALKKLLNLAGIEDLHFS